MMQQLRGGYFWIQRIKYVYLLLKLKANSRHSRWNVWCGFFFENLKEGNVSSCRQSVDDSVAERMVVLG